MKLSTLLAKTVSGQLEYNGETINFEVRSGVLTPAVTVELAELAEPGETAAAVKSKVERVASLVCQLIASWDVLNDDESVFPLDPAAIAASVPVPFLVAIIQKATAILGEAPAAPASVATSSSTLSNTVN